MDKIEAILDVACELFAKKGFEHTPVSEIAEKAGVAGGTIIYHFKTKDNLLHILTWKTLNALFKQARQDVDENAKGEEQVKSFINSFFDFLQTHRNECLLLLKNRPFEKMTNVASGPDMDTMTLHRMYTSFLSEMLAKGVADGSIPPDVSVRETATGVFALLIGSAWLHLFFNEDLAALKSSAVSTTLARFKAAVRS